MRTDKFQANKILNIFLAALCLAIIVFLFVRVFYGIEITDEAFYVSDAIWMLRGNIPYALNNYFAGTGGGFLLIPFLFIYQLIVPELEGVFLFSRIVFLIFHIAAIGCDFLILKKHFRLSGALLYAALLLPLFPAGIINFSYNTVPQDIFILVALVLYDTVEKQVSEKGDSIKLLATGFISGIGIFAHPVYLVAVAVFIVLIIVRSQKGIKIKNAVMYILGGICDIICTLVPIIIQVGFRKLIDGLKPLVLKLYPKGAPSDFGLLQRIKAIVKDSWQVALLPILVLILIGIIFLIIKKFRKNPIKKESLFYIGVSVSALILILYDLIQQNGWNDVNMIGIFAIVCIVILAIFGVYKRHIILAYLGIYPILFSVLMIVVSDSKSYMSRFFAVLPALFICFLIFMEANNIPVRVFTVISALAIVLIFGYNLYSNPYREESLNKLDTRIEKGIYKDIYSTAQKAEDIVELEFYLNTIILANDSFAFRDCVPCGYLMIHNGNMCDMTTWDCMQYHYSSSNAPALLFDYYKRKDDIPDTIVYVNFGRDSQLSIDRSDYLYNDFIDSYYILEEDLVFNDTFTRMIVYRNNGSFDNNYEYWIRNYNIYYD